MDAWAQLRGNGDMTPTSKRQCQNCGAELRTTVVDLGQAPLSNAFVELANQASPDMRHPLHARVCDKCFLVQVENCVPPTEIFSHYAYFSSYSKSWLAHAKAYAEKMIDRFHLTTDDEVIEIASNDGYMLKNFVAKGIPVLGIEPAANIAETAIEKGVNTRIAFFGEQTARALKAEGHAPKLIAAKNVMAHVPDINDFVAGLAVLLEGDAVFTVEFPHLLNLLNDVQFDTIYHEHFTYLSLLAVENILENHGLRVFDVEEVPTHGGSLRVFICTRNASHAECPGVNTIRDKERAANLHKLAGYQGFEQKVKKVRDDLLAFLVKAKQHGKRVAAYGAAAKGNTLLNYCGIGTNMVAYVVDLNPVKQNTLLPGSRIPVYPVERLHDDPVDYILILPWNLRTEIIEQLTPLQADHKFQYVTAIPELRVTTAAV